MAETSRVTRLEELKASVLAANRGLPRNGLVTLTWGNVSGIDRESGLVVIKPSGVAYQDLTIDSLAVLSLSGERVSGGWPRRPTPTHLVLYDPEVGAVVHTHSRWATAWAQAERHPRPRDDARRLLRRRHPVHAAADGC